MPNTARNSKNDITSDPGPLFKKHATQALLAIVVVSCLGVLVFNLLIEGGLSDSRVINRSGRQRMLSQILVKEASLLSMSIDFSSEDMHLRRLRENLLAFETWQKAITERDPEMGLGGKSSTDAVNGLSRVKPSFEKLVAALRAFAEFRGSKQEWSSSKTVMLNQVLEVEEAFVSGMDSVTLIFEQDTRRHMNRYRFAQAIIFLSTIVTLLLVNRRIFRPFAGKLSEYFKKLDNALAILRDQAATDPLTGLFNRRSGMVFLEMEYGRAKREESDMSVIFTDLDNLKTINDTYGHEAGDSMILRFTDAIQSVIRTYDHAFRNGGDEFIIIFGGTSREARRLVERLERKLAQAPMPERQTWGVLFSWGISSLGEDKIQNPEDFVKLSDARMYVQKRAKKISHGEVNR